MLENKNKDEHNDKINNCDCDENSDNERLTKMRRTTLDALHESDGRFSDMIEQAPDAVILVESNTGMILYVNPYACELLRGNFNEIIGRNQSDFFPNEGNEDLLRKYSKEEPPKFIQSYPRRFENTLIRLDGVRIPVEASTKTLLVHGDLLLMGILRDMTHHKRLQSELRVAKEKAERADQLKTEFLSQMSHEVRTPLNTILNFTNVYREQILEKFEGEIAEEMKFSFEVIDKASKRLIRTMDLLMMMSELNTSAFIVRPEKFNLKRDVLERLLNEYKIIAANKNISLEVITNDIKPEVFADRGAVQIALENIIDNAVKFTSKGFVKITFSKGIQNNIILSVKDTGKGISEDYIPFLFEYFSQEEQGYARSFEGNGLGLAIAKRYCDLNNITLEVDSILNKGSEFRLIFAPVN